ncbi:MAG: GumC family protein [Bacteroidota bacterium]
MRSAQVTAQEIKNVFRRRRKYFIFPTLVVVLVSICGAFLLPRKYESSTTIMAQRDEVLNPLVNYTMAVTMATEDRLRTFNEIVFSLSSIQTLVDSLKLDDNIKNEEDRQELIKKIQKNVETERPGETTFKITYIDTDPERAKQGVSILARHFIRTVLRVENQRNESAVQFFENKLAELQQKFQEEQQNIVTLMRDRVSQMPVENQTLWGDLETINKQEAAIDEQSKELKHGQSLIEQFSEDQPASKNTQILFELQRTDLPHVGDLRPMILKYDEFSRRYTSKYPEARKLSSQISEILLVMEGAIQEELTKQLKHRTELEVNRFQIVDNLKQSAAYQELDKDKKSNFDIARNLYDDMKIKLEQARTTRDLGRKGSEQFIIIDPPVVPTKPSKPNRLMIILGGLGLGLLVGVFSTGLAELLDPTIRNPHDIYVYKKRVVAFLPESPK